MNFRNTEKPVSKVIRTARQRVTVARADPIAITKLDQAAGHCAAAISAIRVASSSLRSTAPDAMAGAIGNADHIDEHFVRGVRGFLEARRGHYFEGTPAELLIALAHEVPEDLRQSRRWPASAIGLGSRLSRNVSALAAAGVRVSSAKSGVRYLRLELAGKLYDPTSQKGDR